jgi:DNA-binding transcriptional LysR family regulator
MKLTLLQLEIFREVMETGSMSIAARNLNKTQPAVSLTLKGLENALGFPLFARANRKLIPAPEAHYLLAEANAVLNQIARVQRNMERLSLGEEGTLQVAAMPGLATALLPAFLADYAESRPDIKYSLYTRSSAQLQEMVGSQSLDMGTGDFDENAARSARTSTTRISGLCYVAVPANSRLALRTSAAITPLQLSDQPLGSLQPEHPFTKRLMACFSNLTQTPDVKHLSQTLLPLLQFVARGQCVAVVDPLTVATTQSLKLFQQDIIFKRFKSPLRYEYALVSPKFRPPSLLANDVRQQWLNHLESLLQQLKAEPEISSVDTEFADTRVLA